jgi:predicted ferric reductase
MSSVAHQSPQETALPVIYRLHRWLFAACIVLGIGATLVLVATSPQYDGLHNGIPVMVAAFATASPVLLQAHLLSGVFAVYLLPGSLLAMAWLAMRRSPWLASIVTLIVFISRGFAHGWNSKSEEQ